MTEQHYFPYHEPDLVQILVLASFIILLNLARWVADYLANVGILGELLVGLIYGAPLAGILDVEWQSTFTSLGYIGLIILVLEGGLSTNLALARQNLTLSVFVALTGLLAPILLSLILLHLGYGFSLLQAFTAGAALSTTSLGTTFSVISQAGFATTPTRLGAVLTSAAVTDDVVGLILLQVVVSLGAVTGGSAENTDQANRIGWAVGRPLLASLAMLSVSWIMTRWIVIPIYSWITRKLRTKLAKNNTACHAYNLCIGTLLAFAYVAVASASGTSVLLGAFVAGLVLATLSSELSAHSLPTFANTYEAHMHQIQTYLLRPFFFASIGYAIPIRSLFTGKIVWQGIVYTLICTVSKLVCGAFVLIDYWVTKLRRSKGRILVAKKSNGSTNGVTAPQFPPTTQPSAKSRVPSLLPASFLLGSAMVARGEISLLIVNLARVKSPGLMPDDLFYITIWAVLLTTIIGPVAVGLTIKSMQRNGKTLPEEWAAQGAGPKESNVKSSIKRAAKSPGGNYAGAGTGRTAPTELSG